jgi:hypothetical protein
MLNTFLIKNLDTRQDKSNLYEVRLILDLFTLMNQL